MTSNKLDKLITSDNQCNDISIFRDIFDGQDIYVIGSGKSCDYINSDFFDNKITIGVNQVYKKLNTTFLLRKEHKFLKSIINDQPNTIHIVSAGNCGRPDNINRKYIETIQCNNVYYFNHKPNQNSRKILLPNLDKHELIVSWSTITSAIHFASFLGAKNIILVGHDCCTINGEANFTGYHTTSTISQKNMNDYKKWLTKIEYQSIFVKKYLQKEYNCNIYSLNPFINFKFEGNQII